MKKILYLDNSATTPVRKEVVLAMKNIWNKDFGNPSSITKMGVKAKQILESARKEIAEVLKARPVEIVFTASGTESNNLAIFGIVNNLLKKGRKISDMHFVTTNIEHSSISECFKELESRGAMVDYLEVGPRGILDLKDLRKALKANTVLVSIGYANGEIGTIQPIKDIAKEIRHARKNSDILDKATLYPVFHTDASQAGLYLNLNTAELGVDLLTLDAQKIYGPKGVGLLFVKAGVEISPIIFGGGQESGLRSGTENVPLIVGMGKALEIARKEYENKSKKIKIIRDYLYKEIKKNIPEAILNGDLENRLSNNLNISIPGIDPEFTVLCLDEVGIVCSTKSACKSMSDGSSVVEAINPNKEIAKSTLRFCLGEDISKVDINFVVSNLKKIVQKQFKFNLK